jgi:altronate hydrolase
MLSSLLQLASDDDVAVAIRKIPAGTQVGAFTACDEIPMAHKVALHTIPAGAQVRKFGVPIGRATRDIAAGELVHVHNLASDYLVNDVDHFEE